MTGAALGPGAEGDLLTGKVILVTGGGSTPEGHGTGSAMAIVFARQGAIVGVMDLDPGRAQATVSDIEAAGGTATAYTGDVSDEQACHAVIETLSGDHGRIDGLVNNVGIPGGSSVLDTDVATWERVMSVNVTGALLMSQAVLPRMIDQGGGSILNIASIAGLLPNGVVAYSSSKAALISLTRELAVGYGRKGVRANVICPGHILAPLSRNRDPAELERRRRVGPLGIEGTPWDVAWAALFLMSDWSRFITAAVLPVDGGVTSVAPMMTHRLLND